jgi:hypothetical protein
MESPITLSAFDGFLEPKLINVELVAFCESYSSFKVIRSGSDHE